MTSMSCGCGCGQTTAVYRGTARRFVHGHHSRGANHYKWNGGRARASAGYVLIRAPGHPRVDGRGYVLEHVLVVERAFGKFLDRKHPIHHVDENKANNANNNLVACNDQAYHQLIHQRQNALVATGNPNALPCVYCGSYERQGEMVAHKKRGGRAAHHPKCRNEHRASVTYNAQKAARLNRRPPSGDRGIAA